jgi:hypothetical protein
MPIMTSLLQVHCSIGHLYREDGIMRDTLWKGGTVPYL